MRTVITSGQPSTYPRRDAWQRFDASTRRTADGHLIWVGGPRFAFADGSEVTPLRAAQE